MKKGEKMSKEQREKIKESNILTYRNSAILQKRRKENNPFSWQDVKEKIRKRLIAKYQDKDWVKRKSEKQAKTLRESYATKKIIIWNKNLTKETDERVKNYSIKGRISKIGVKSDKKGKTFEEMYGIRKAKFLKEKHNKKIVEHYLKGDYSYKGRFFSQKSNKTISYRSSYELKAFQRRENDPEILRYEYESFAIAYIDKNNQLRYTVPDLKTWYRDGTIEIAEVKPAFMIEKDLNNTNLKLNAIKNYAKNNGYKFSLLTEKELEIKSRIKI